MASLTGCSCMGRKTKAYINELKSKVSCPVIQAFSVRTKEDVLRAGKLRRLHFAGSGQRRNRKVFDWTLIESIGRPFFLAGGLNAENIKEAVRTGTGRSTSAAAQKPTVLRIGKNFRVRSGSYGRRRNTTDGKRQIWNTRRTVHPGDADE